MEPRKINCPSVGFCGVSDRQTELTWVWACSRRLYHNGFLGLLNSGFKVLGKIRS